MSPTLAEIVGHPEYNGLYRLPADAAAPANVVAIAGMTGKAAMLAAVAGALDFPDYFGGNWDALEECLTDLSWRDGPVALLLADAATAETVAPEDWALLLDILADAARHWRDEGRAFAVFLQGGSGDYPPLAV